MLSILFVNGPAERGGGEVVLRNIVTNLDRTRFRPVVVFLRPGPLVAEFQQAGITTYLIEAGRFRNLWRTFSAVRQLFLIVRREKIDLVQSAGSKIHIYGGLAALLAHRPAVIVVQDNLNQPGKWEKLARWIPARLLIANSRSTLETSQAFFKSHRIIVIHPGTDPARFDPTANPILRTELGLTQDEVAIGVFARLQRMKGLAVFVEAANAVRQRTQQARFFIIGGTLFEMEKEHLTELEDQIKRLDVGNNVKMLGFREDVPELMQAMDVVVSASVLPEGFGLTLVEAMLTGRPVVATAHGGPLEIIDDTKTGFLVTPGDPVALAERLLDLINQPELRSNMGQAGRQEALSRFSLSTMITGFETAYQGLVNRPGC